MRPKPREEGGGERRAGWRERLCVAMSLVLALSSVPTAGLAEAAGDFWSPDGIEYVLDKPSPEEGAAIAGPECV